MRKPGETGLRRLGGSLWLLTLRGEHDLTTVPALRAAFARAEATRTSAIVDLTEVTFIDTAVLGVLVVERERGENLLLVASARGQVRRLLDQVGLRSPFRVFETHDEALRAVPTHTERPEARVMRATSEGTGAALS